MGIRHCPKEKTTSLSLQNTPQYNADHIFPIRVITSDKVKNSTLKRSSCAHVNTYGNNYYTEFKSFYFKHLYKKM